MILSKRWKQLWLGGQLILNFNDQASTLILSCKTLVVLNLNNLVFEEDIPPYVVDLPSLKLLHLESITFTFYSYLIKILSSCPILQELETKDLTVKNNYRVHPDIPNTHVTLSKLIRANISGMHIMYDFLNNVEHLELQVMTTYGIESMFHNLTHLEITFDTMPFDGYFKWRWLTIDLLRKLPKLQSLIIVEVDIVNNSGDGEWVDPKVVPECLLSHLTTCSLRNYSRINCELQFAKYIMKNSKVLNTMTIQVAKSVKSDIKFQMLTELSSCPINSPTCELLVI
ncbi:Zinc finger FYVE domain-containing protein 26 [Trifolium repens]|nr:Zinc finger FYVE domain-containing protein 26 [Trifolium repens]